ncbi:cation diffusion facilitator family transporter [Sphingobium sufflavum]|uniref:cation diffusion facilitator family transporter n=1 Tax=Sphingobium sufflavum TaxID=1129547 RepID=UPI001F411078|nr:cation diffusion facilitator family transporter [Sphingobium sufflavum]MCE7795602.1 cation diffusion facilitator family transporter [Sphingobium sufflavum]
MTQALYAAQDRQHLAATGALNRRAAVASVSAALLLGLLKGYALWATGSIAMLGSLADTALDLVASLVTLVAVHVAAQPADAHHRFGHGKAEALAALFQVSLISVAAIAIIARSVDRLQGGAAPEGLGTGVGVSLAAMAVTLALLAYQRRIIRRTGSVAIQADNVHYQSDLLLNGAVIAALLLDIVAGLRGADALFGIAIGLWLGWGAWRASTQAIDQLMDREWPLDRRERFLAVASRHPELQGIHDLRTRTAGARDFVQFHVWMDPFMPLSHAHRVMDEVESRLRLEFPGVEILIHPDPVGHVDKGDPLTERDARDLVADQKAERRGF